MFSLCRMSFLLKRLSKVRFVFSTHTILQMVLSFANQDKTNFFFLFSYSEDLDAIKDVRGLPNPLLASRFAAVGVALRLSDSTIWVGTSSTSRIGRTSRGEYAARTVENVGENEESRTPLSSGPGRKRANCLRQSCRLKSHLSPLSAISDQLFPVQDNRSYFGLTHRVLLWVSVVRALKRCPLPDRQFAANVPKLDTKWTNDTLHKADKNGETENKEGARKRRPA